MAGPEGNMEAPKPEYKDDFLKDVDDLLQKIDEDDGDKLKKIDDRYNEGDISLLDNRLKWADQGLKTIEDQIKENDNNKNPEKEAILRDRQVKFLERKVKLEGEIAKRKAELREEQGDRVAEKKGEIANTVEKEKEETKERYGDLQGLQQKESTLTQELSDIDDKIKADEASMAEANDQTKIDLAKNLGNLNREKAEKESELKDVKKEIEKLTKDTSEEKMRAKALAYARMEAEAHEQDAAEAERKLEEELRKMEGQPTSSEGAAAPVEEAGEDEEEGVEPAEEGGTEPRENAEDMSPIDESAFLLTKDLADHIPDKEDSFEKTIYQGKVLLLRVLMAFGSNTNWLGKMTERQRDNLKKAAGLVVVDGVDKKGEREHTAEWVDPDPEFASAEAGLNGVFESAFGEDWEEALKKVDENTTMDQFVGLFSDAEQKTQTDAQTFHDLMIDAGAEPGDKVTEFLGKNFTRIIEEYEKKARSSESKAAFKEVEKAGTTPEEARKFVVENLLKKLNVTDTSFTFSANSSLFEVYLTLHPTNQPPSDSKESDLQKYNATLAQFMKGDIDEAAFKVYLMDRGSGTEHEVDVAIASFIMIRNACKAVTIAQALEAYQPKGEKEKTELESAKSRIK